MRLVLIGNPALERSWKNDIAHAARSLGWATTVLQDSHVTTVDVAGACRNADLLIWARSHGKQPHGDIEAMWRQVEAQGCATVAVHLDLYWGIARREAEIGVHPWWRAGTVWTADGGHDDLFAQRGVNHRWLPPPCPDRYVGRVPPRRELACDVLFVGSCSSVHPGRRELLDWAQARYRDRFRWVGARSGQRVWGVDLSAWYASAKVVLGDSAPADRYWSDRVPCTAGRGGVLVHPHVEGLGAQFGNTVQMYRRGDWRNLGQLIDSLLDDPARRERIRAQAVGNVRQHHLWRHRLAAIAAETALGVSR